MSVVNLDHLAGIDPEEPAFRGPLRANASARRATAALVDEHGARDWDTLVAGFDDVSYDQRRRSPISVLLVQGDDVVAGARVAILTQPGFSQGLAYLRGRSHAASEPPVVSPWAAPPSIHRAPNASPLRAIPWCSSAPTSTRAMSQALPLPRARSRRWVDAPLMPR